MSKPATAAEVVIVGGGPAGLACALELRGREVAPLVVERESEPGGIPRHCAHQGFGLRDLRRVMSGPGYARRYAGLAQRGGVEVATETMVTGVSAGGELELTSPQGRRRLAPRAVVLATGCREHSRSARLVAGSRPEGVLSTGMLQQLVHVHGVSPGRRALVVGAEHVSFSALATLRRGGARALAMVTEHERHASLAAFRLGGAAVYRVPLWTGTRVAAIHGRARVERVDLESADGDATRSVDCDTVVFTADWIPDHELAVAAGLGLDPGTRGPVVDAALRTSRPGWFAAGNVLHGAETADVAALEGRHAAAGVIAFLAGAVWPAARAPILCEPPLAWAAPNAIAAGELAPPRGRFSLRADRFLSRPRIEIAQSGRSLWRGTVRRLGPGRSSRLPSAWSREADPSAESIVVRTLSAGD
ncbi:MAG: NAD(P)/FAD-dependent oxidoreductase [Solirubrobacterales bacterium]